MKNIYGETPHEQFTKDTLSLLDESPVNHSNIAPLVRLWVQLAGADTADGVPAKFETRFEQATLGLRETYPQASEASLIRAGRIGRVLALRALSI